MALDSPDTSIALLGFGTVGSAVARRLAAGALPGLRLTHVLDRRADEKRHAIPGPFWTSCFDEVLASDADIVVEAIGGLEPAADWIRAALAAGKSVVTANKQVIAHHGVALLAFAARQGRQLRFEAAVGGAMPIVRAVGEGLAGDRLTRLVGVLNGTSNAVLSRVETTGCAIADAVRFAQARGWAEADPSADLDGVDARAKLAILCALAFGLHVAPSRIETRSIARIGAAQFHEARRRGATVRQVAWAEFDRARAALTAWVAPALVPRESIFARLTGPANAAIVSGLDGGDTGIFGTGAGGAATAVAVISDLIAVARDRAAIVPPPALSAPTAVRGLDRCGDLVDFIDLLRVDQAARETLAEAV